MHGLDGVVYTLLSNEALQVNSRFTFPSTRDTVLASTGLLTQ